MSWNRGIRGQQLEVPRPCLHCGQMRSKAYFDERRLQKVIKIKEALKERQNNGETVGRPRTIDYDRIHELRAAGHSLSKVAELMSCSKRTVSLGSISHAIYGDRRKK